MIFTIIILSLILTGATICACFKPGENDGISNYNYKEN